MKPAIVEYQGRSSKKFTKGKQYEAFFLEYWEGVRNSLHVRGNDGRVTDFNPFEYFALISDDDNLLNDYEATVKCITRRFEDIAGCHLIYGKEYKAIGRDKAGINHTNDQTKTEGMTLTQIIAKKDALGVKVSAYKDAFDGASETIGLANDMPINVTDRFHAAYLAFR